MCLIKNKYSKELIAEKDIICYKAAYKTPSGYVTPFYRQHVELGRTYVSDIEHCVNKYVIGGKNKSVNVIEKGLHSYKTKYACITYNDDNTQISLIKCIIPKGSKYWIGKFMKYDCYVSSAITYVSVFKEGNRK